MRDPLRLRFLRFQVALLSVALLLCGTIATPAVAESGLPAKAADNNRDDSKTVCTPPFPEREDLFVPPAHKPGKAASRPQNDRHALLMGFANVGEPRVLLTIDGIVTPLRQGESRGGIHVLSIDPPKVTLQRAGRKWTECLDNR